MIRNIIFDFGSVLVRWDPHNLYDPYFKDRAKADWFLENICPYSWNESVDAGRPTVEATAERLALYPEWEKEIRMYFGEWIKMMDGQVPGMEELVKELKVRGYSLYGLTNWSAETFPQIRDSYPIFSLLDGIVVSGEEHMKKPDPEIYRILLRRYNLKPEECIFIDDNPRNVAAGEAEGIKGLVFTSPEQLRMDLRAILQ